MQRPLLSAGEPATLEAPRTDIAVEPVVRRAQREAFLGVPRRVYHDDPHWIEPLRVERRMHLSARNPVFGHMDWQAWVATVDGEPVGRITAQIDRLHRQRYGADSGHFGMLEAIDDDAVFAHLFRAAESWLAQRGARRVTGPFNLSINEECGLLIDGFDTPPVVMMGHARPYYARHIEAHGYAPAKDLLAYRVNTDFQWPEVMRSLAAHYGEHIRVRPMRRKELKQELEVLRDIFNDAWSGNWGFVPFTEAEFRELGNSLRLLVPADFIQVAEVDGEPAAFIVMLPNINEAIRDLDGRLLPLGWAKLLWRLKLHSPSSGRVPLMGVRRRYQHSRLGPALAFAVIGAVQTPSMRAGIREVELSWILEDNAGMRHILDALGSEAYKRYRLYEKCLEADA